MFKLSCLKQHKCILLQSENQKSDISYMAKCSVPSENWLEKKLSVNSYRISVWDDKNVQEMDNGDGHTTL